jgi:hypothetical protein
MQVGSRTHTYRFFEASPQKFDLDFLLKWDTADGVPLLAELVPEVLTVKNNGLRYHPGFEIKLSHGRPQASEFGFLVVGDFSLRNV